MSRQITHDGAGALAVRFPYDRTLVDRIKTLPRRRWDAGRRVWSVPEEDVVLLVDLLEPQGFSVDEATGTLYGALGGRLTLRAAATPVLRHQAPGLFDFDEPEAPSVDGAADHAEDLTVSALNERVQAVLREAFPAPLWLVGEIAGFNKSAHRRHVGFDIVERSDSGATVSKITAILFESDRRSIEQELRRAGEPFRLEDEISVRLSVQVSLYPAWGQYRVVVEGIDVHYTLGEAARRREEIVRKLTEAGLVGRNSALPLPELPLRVALITSLGSDAYNDVLRTLADSAYAFRVEAHGARVQGHATEPSVLNALDRIRARHECFDVVLICRGGGSRTDLVWFDTEPLGRAVAEFPLPVVVGIGHEQDLSVLDAVGRSSKTPTAAAHLLVERIDESLRRLETLGRSVTESAAARVREERGKSLERGRRLAAAALGKLDRERTALSHRRHRMIVGGRAVCATARRQVLHWLGRVPRSAGVRIERQRSRVEGLTRGVARAARADLRAGDVRLRGLVRAIDTAGSRLLRWRRERLEDLARRTTLVDPRRVLERGYAILRDDAGTVVTDAALVPLGTVLWGELRRGELKLRAEGLPKNESEE